MKTYALAIPLVVSVVLSAAQQSAPPRGPNTSSGSASHAPPTIDSIVATPPLATSDQEKVQELTHRVQMLELQMAQRSGNSESGKNVAIITAGIGAAAVLLAGLVAAGLGIFGQLLAGRRAAKLARDEALYRDAGQILEFRMKQVQQFYAPIFALLRQSKDLYDKMLEQLVQD